MVARITLVAQGRQAYTPATFQPHCVYDPCVCVCVSGKHMADLENDIRLRLGRQPVKTTHQNSVKRRVLSLNEQSLGTIMSCSQIMVR